MKCFQKNKYNRLGTQEGRVEVGAGGGIKWGDSVSCVEKLRFGQWLLGSEEVSRAAPWEKEEHSRKQGQEKAGACLGCWGQKGSSVAGARGVVVWRQPATAWPDHMGPCRTFEGLWLLCGAKWWVPAEFLVEKEMSRLSISERKPWPLWVETIWMKMDLGKEARTEAKTPIRSLWWGWVFRIFWG